MRGRAFRAVIGATVLSAALAMPASAAPTAAMDASPEFQYYSCGAAWVLASWTVNAAGSGWKVWHGDGTSAGWYPISDTSHSHWYNPAGYCVDYTAQFQAKDNYGNYANDWVRVVVQI